jgi:hypothetical protein
VNLTHDLSKDSAKTQMPIGSRKSKHEDRIDLWGALLGHLAGEPCALAIPPPPHLSCSPPSQSDIATVVAHDGRVILLSNMGDG